MRPKHTHIPWKVWAVRISNFMDKEVDTMFHSWSGKAFSWWSQTWSRPRRRAGRSRSPRFVPRLEGMEDRTLLSPGVLDPNFGAGGKTTVAFGGGNNASALGMALQPDGKIVVVGSAQMQAGSRDYDFAISRTNAHGTLAKSF